VIEGAGLGPGLSVGTSEGDVGSGEVDGVPNVGRGVGLLEFVGATDGTGVGSGDSVGESEGGEYVGVRLGIGVGAGESVGDAVGPVGLSVGGSVMALGVTTVVGDVIVSSVEGLRAMIGAVGTPPSR
jgi:hypothetical protein